MAPASVCGGGGTSTARERKLCANQLQRDPAAPPALGLPTRAKAIPANTCARTPVHMARLGARELPTEETRDTAALIGHMHASGHRGRCKPGRARARGCACDSSYRNAARMLDPPAIRIPVKVGSAGVQFAAGKGSSAAAIMIRRMRRSRHHRSCTPAWPPR